MKFTVGNQRINKDRVFAHLARGDPINTREVHKFVQVVHMQGKAFVYISNEDNRCVLNFAVVSDCTVVSDNLCDYLCTFNGVFHVDVVLVFYKHIILTYPVGIAVAYTDNRGSDFLASTMGKKCLIVSFGDKAFFVR